MILFDDVVNVGDTRGDTKGQDEGGNVMVVGPNGNKDGVEDGEEREPPGDSVDDDGFCVGGGELINDSAEEEQMDDRPSEEGPIGWGEVRLLDVTVDGVRGGYGVDVRPQEEEVDDDVDNLEKDTVFPLCRSHFCCPSLGGRERGGRQLIIRVGGLYSTQGWSSVERRHRRDRGLLSNPAVASCLLTSPTTKIRRAIHSAFE